MKLLLYYVHIRLVTKELELFNSDPTLPIYFRNTTGYDVQDFTERSTGAEVYMYITPSRCLKMLLFLLTLMWFVMKILGYIQPNFIFTNQ